MSDEKEQINGMVNEMSNAGTAIDPKAFFILILSRILKRRPRLLNLSASWRPEDGDNYAVEIFMCVGMDRPLPLSDMTVNNNGVR